MAVFKGNLAIDPRGMIYEAYRIEAVTLAECRMIFLDWAMNTPEGDMKSFLQELLDEYAANHQPDHPMTQLVMDGLASSKGLGGRRGGRTKRVFEN